MNRKKNSPTIYDVAAAAKVSTATVSRVFSNSNYPVSSQTREQILSIAAELGYVYKRTPVPAGERRDVHVLVPNLENPFYMALIDGMEASLRAYDLNMILMNTNDSLQQERKIIASLAARKSAVILSPITSETQHLNMLLDSGCELVLIEQFLSSHCSSIQFNSCAGGRMATEYLIERGLRRIAYLSPALIRPTRKDVYQGFEQAMANHQIPVCPELVCVGDDSDSSQADTIEIGVELCRKLLAGAAQLPEGICCENDLIAIGAMGYLLRQGIRVPEDVSVIGLDNIPFGSLVFPGLTTVDQCTREMGSLAAELIHGNLMDPARKRVQLLLEPRLVIRDSVI